MDASHDFLFISAPRLVPTLASPCMNVPARRLLAHGSMQQRWPLALESSASVGGLYFAQTAAAAADCVLQIPRPVNNERKFQVAAIQLWHAFARTYMETHTHTQTRETD